MKIYNTLTDKLEDFKSLKENKVTMYHCGPTVYNYVHIGNLRSYVLADILRRAFEYENFEVKQVINITDIGHLTSDADSGDDKMVKGLKREGLPISLDGLKQLSDKYTKAFEEDLYAINIKKPDYLPKATDYLENEIELIKTLETKGFTYKLEDGVYFDTAQLPDYGKLSGLTPINESEARVDVSGKKSPRDFVLWKISTDGHLGFPSPWGNGFPGWHIECSAMSKELLGQPFDIHTGGIDHIPVHHNNEIAQSEAAYGTLLANYWIHNEFVNLSGAKMAKSEGNILTLKTLEEKGFSPLAYRYFLLLSHYRSPTNFTWEALEAAQNALNKLKNTMSRMPLGSGVVNETYKAQFKEKIENDFNTAQAIAVIWTMLKDKDVSSEDKLATIKDFDKVLGLGL